MKGYAWKGGVLGAEAGIRLGPRAVCAVCAVCEAAYCLHDLHCSEPCELRICGCTCALAGAASSAAMQQQERSSSSGKRGGAARRAAQDRGGPCPLRSACAICSFVSWRLST